MAKITETKEDLVSLPFYDQFLVGIDQLVNTMIWSSDEGWGMADETISARAFRKKDHSGFWKGVYRTVNILFFWQPVEDHCENAYLYEVFRKQLPSSYSSSTEK